MLLLLFFGCSTAAFTQNVAMNWILGERGHLNFASTPVTATHQHILSLPEGGVSISDPVSGELQLYGNGIHLWDGDNGYIQLAIIPGASFPPEAEFSASTTQSGIMLHSPTDYNTVYVFNPGNRSSLQGRAPNLSDVATRLMDNMTVTTVDMRGRDGKGDFVVRQSLATDVPLSEKLSAIPDCDGCGYWIVARSLDLTRFLAWHMGPEGVEETPVVSEIGLPSINGMAGIGQHKISPDGCMLASVTLDEDRRVLELFDFDIRSGIVSNLRVVRMDNRQAGFGGFSSYGVSFSPDSKQVYVTTLDAGASSLLLQFDLSNPDAAAIEESVAEVLRDDNLESRFGSLQLGIDGRLYVARTRSEFLGVVERPNVRGLACGAVLDGISVRPPGQNSRSTLGLPGFAESWFGDGPRRSECGVISAAIEFPAVECSDKCVQFTERSSGTICRRDWQFEGGSPRTSSEMNPTVCFEQAGSYAVRYVCSNLWRSDTLDTVIVFQDPSGERVVAGRDTVICPGESIELAADGPGIVSWQPDATLERADSSHSLATPTGPTDYVARMITSKGCIVYDTVHVALHALQLASPDQITVCPGESVSLVVRNGEDLTWSPSDDLNRIDGDSVVATPTQSREYTVRGTVEGCAVETVVQVRLAQAPKITIPDTMYYCSKGQARRIDVESDAIRFSWSPETGLDDAASPSPIVEPATTTTYYVRCWSADDCFVDDSITVVVTDVIDLKVARDTYRICPGDAVELRALTDEPVRWTPADGLNRTDSNVVLASPDRTIIYLVELTDGSECSEPAAVRVDVESDGIIEIEVFPELYCDADSVELRALTDLDVEWPDIDERGTLNDHVVRVAVRDAATFNVQLRNNSCSASGSVTLHVGQVGDVNIESPELVCDVNRVPVKAIGLVDVEWQPAELFDDPTAVETFVQVNESVTLRLSGLDEQGCRGESTATVVVRNKASVNVKIPDFNTAPGESSELSFLFETASTEYPIVLSGLRMRLLYHPGNLQIVDAVSAAQIVNREVVNVVLHAVTLEFDDIVLNSNMTSIAGLKVMGLAGGSHDSQLFLTDLEFANEECLLLAGDASQLEIDEYCLSFGIVWRTPLNLQVLNSPGGTIQISLQPRQGSVSQMIELYDAYGRQHNRWRRSGDGDWHLEVDSGTMPEGVYFVRGISDHAFATRMILVLH